MYIEYFLLLFSFNDDKNIAYEFSLEYCFNKNYTFLYVVLLFNKQHVAIFFNLPL